MRLPSLLIVLAFASLLAGGCSRQDTSAGTAVELVAIDSHFDNNAIALWWEPVVDGVEEWVVERSRDSGGPWTPIGVVGADERPEGYREGYARFWDSGLTPGEDFYYRVYGCAAEGRTENSNMVSGVVPEFMPGLEPPISTPVAVTAPC